MRTGSKVRDLGLDPQEIAGRDPRGAADASARRSAPSSRCSPTSTASARWGDKRPAYFHEVDVLLRLFPDAQIVHIVRDGRANVASLKKMPWWPYDSIGSMATWSQAEFCSQRNSTKLPADTFHVIRYESLVADPEPVLRELCAFLDEDFDPAMLEPSEVRDVVPEKKTWHEQPQRRR